MEWTKFKSKFHPSWHSSVQKFIESNECNKIYAFLKNQKGIEIAPKSNLTFRSFEQDLKEVKIVVLLEEPYTNKYNDTQYADGIPLSCEYVDKLHPQLREFYEAMEREFYDLNLNTIMNNHLKFLTNQGVLFLSSSLTSEIGSPGKHKKLWIPFMKHLIKNVFCKKNIPIIFCGEELYDTYSGVVEPVYPYFLIKQPISSCTVGVPWNTDNVFARSNKYLWEETTQDDIMWVNQDVPF